MVIDSAKFVMTPSDMIINDGGLCFGESFFSRKFSCMEYLPAFGLNVW